MESEALMNNDSVSINGGVDNNEIIKQILKNV